MARVALCTDRESWQGKGAAGDSDCDSLSSSCVDSRNSNDMSSQTVILAKEESQSDSVKLSVESDSDLYLLNPSSLNSVAFSLDDDEAKNQVREYAHKLQADQIESRRRRKPATAGSPSSGWTHGAEMKFDTKELLITKTVLLDGSSACAKRSEIREYFHRTFSLYERLFELLTDSSVFYRRPDSLRHPLIFYYGHTAVFFINKLMLGKFISKRIDHKMESTCAIGVDEMSWDDLNDSHYDWPTPDAVRNYRNLVRSTVDDVIQSAPLNLPITWDSAFWVILMGIEHERIHLETSSVLIRQLPIECVRTHPLWQICQTRRNSIESVPANRLISLGGGDVLLGKDVANGVTYGWDNEYGSRASRVDAFSVSQFLVSNAEWLEFMADGCYDREEFWSEEGWKFIQFKNVQRKYPLFWVSVNGDIAAPARPENFRYRALSEVIDMPWDWPVEVNELEAKAFTNWKSRKTGKKIRLPTEDEYNHMRNVAFPLRPNSSLQASSSSPLSSSSSSTCSSPALGDQPYWESAPGNINLEFYASSNPIDEFAFKCLDADGMYVDLFDVIGNVWQHTETPIAPFAGFQFHPLYDDFSIPTFDNKHNLLMGGSWIATGNEAIRSARYAFRRHFYQHAGIRYVESQENVIVEELTPSTETDVEVANMAAAHYATIASAVVNMQNPFVSLARIIMAAVETERHRFTRTPFNSALFETRQLTAIDLAQLESVAHLPPTFERVMDLGCGAGRLCFELAFDGNHPNHSLNGGAGIGASSFQSVLGIDLSTRFLRVGDSLKSGGKFHYLVKSEGELDAFHAIDLNDSKYCERNTIQWTSSTICQQVCGRVEFMQSDAHNLDRKHTAFDVIVMAHLLEELRQPMHVLDIVRHRCKLGGLLVILSDYNWRSVKTARDEWIGGKKENTGESVNTLNALDTVLANHFVRIIKPQNMLQIRRCTDRVFTMHNAELTIWRRVK